MNRLVMGRISQIVKVSIKEGFGYLVDELNLKAHIPFFYRVKKTKIPIKDEAPVRVRRIFENLGGAFIKLGQLLSLRPDLVPNEYCEEFRKLQDEIGAFPYFRVKKIIRKELKKPISKLFKEFRKKPLGSASVGQAHFARLKDGKKVVVKIQRPGVDKLFESDIDVMYYIAKKFEKKCKKHNFSPIKIIKEFERYSKEELDYLIEGKHVQIFHDNFIDSEKIKIPALYSHYSTSKILTTEYIEGEKLSELMNSNKKFNRIRVALAIFELTLKQIFQTNIFHADLHPGNILVMNDGRIGLVDFGITGTLPDPIKEQGIRLYLALIDQNVNQIYGVISSIGVFGKDTDLVAFKKDLNTLVRGWGSTFKKEKVSSLLLRILDLCMQHNINIPANLVVLGKALLTVEGTCTALYPTFNFIEESKPYIVELIKGELKTDISVRNLVKKTFELKDFVEELPKKTLQALDTIQRGNFDISVEDKEMKGLGQRLSITGDRVSIALIAASFVVAGALIFQVNPAPAYFGYSIFAVLAFGLAGLLILSLVLSFFKSAKTA